MSTVSSRIDEVLDSDGNTYLLSIDPGESIGIALGIFATDEPYELIETWQPRGGAVGFLNWWHSPALFNAAGHWGDRDLIVSERFILRSSPKDGRVPNVEPVRIEGVMLGLGMDVHYQDRWMKASVNDSILKEHGLWQTGKKFDHPDGRDANDALIHALAYLKSIRHLPTLRKFWN